MDSGIECHLVGCFVNDRIGVFGPVTTFRCLVKKKHPVGFQCIVAKRARLEMAALGKGVFEIIVLAAENDCNKWIFGIADWKIPNLEIMDKRSEKVLKPCRPFLAMVLRMGDNIMLSRL